MALKVSVVICAYNYARFLPQCLESVISQTYPPDEIIVVDDGSTDETKEAVCLFDNIHYIRQEHAGKAAAFNRGFAESSGDIICHIDADDYWFSTKLEKVIEAFERHSVGGVTHGILHVDEDGKLLSNANTIHETLQVPTHLSFQETLISWFFHRPINAHRKLMGIPNTISVRKKAVEDVFPLPSDIDLAIDGALVLSSARSGLLSLREYLSAYRIHGANYMLFQPLKGRDRIRLFQLLPEIIKSRDNLEGHVMEALINENKAHFAMGTGKGVIEGTIAAAMLIPQLLSAKLIPHWKHFALPVACLIQWGRVRSRLNYYQTE